MRFRWSIEQLETWSDNKFLRALVTERMSGLNPYAPLYQRLRKMESRLLYVIDAEERGRMITFEGTPETLRALEVAHKLIESTGGLNEKK